MQGDRISAGEPNRDTTGLSMAKLHLERVIEVGVSAEEIWPYVAQTDRLNREIGLPGPEFSFKPRPSGGTDVTAVAKLGPLTFRYEEHPFEWVRPEWFHVRRVFKNGPVRTVIAGTRIESTPNGARVTAYSDVECPNWAIPIARVMIGRSLGPLERAFRRFDQVSRNEQHIAYPKLTEGIRVRRDRLSASMKSLTLERIDSRLLSKFEAILCEEPDPDVQEFRSRELARRMGWHDEREVLHLCLAATRHGILELEWRVMCPYCRSNRTVFHHLHELKDEAHCVACAIRFDSRFDENVEVVFSVAEAIRQVSKSIFCVGGPENTPFASAQIIVPSMSEKSIVAPTGVGGIRLVCLQRSGRPTIEIATDAMAAVAIDLDSSNRYRLAPNGTISIQNRNSEQIEVRLEDVSQLPMVTTAAEVTCLQQFRDQFSSEVLAPGHEMSIRQVTILFTDLKGSTRMYRERGDAPSYAAVRSHFEFLYRVIAAGEGVVIKTIGDAVMAAFANPTAAIRAALDIQRIEDELITKIGLHTGPAILVNANGILDYFGRTVNLASRLQKHSLGGDVVLSEESMCPSIVDADIEPFEAEVPDIYGSMRLLRLRPMRVRTQ